MKLGDIYNLAIQNGMIQDPRGKNKLLKILKENKNTYKKLGKKERAEFDLETLINPYADTRILNGDLNTNIKRAIVGIDIGVEEMVLVDRLNSRNKGIDLVVAHHPQGIAAAGFYGVMNMQVDILADHGIPRNVGEGLLNPRIDEVARRVHSANHSRSVDAAKLLGLPFMCMHTVADNHVSNFINNLMNKNKPKRVSDIVDILKQIPEYKLATKDKSGPKLIMGDLKRKVGKILVEMTGGTEGPKELFDKYDMVGIDTIIGMHLSEEGFKQAKGKNLNIIIAGHIASDNIGLNLLFDNIQKKGKLDIVECSGFRRIER